MKTLNNMKTFNIGNVVTKKSGKPFKSGKKEETIVDFTINEIDPKRRNAVVFADGSICNIEILT